MHKYLLQIAIRLRKCEVKLSTIQYEMRDKAVDTCYFVFDSILD